MVAQVQTTSNAPISTTAKWTAALQRATVGRVVVYRTPHYGVYHVTSGSQPGTEYTVQTAGPRWDELTCTCPAGQHGRICLHQAATVFARHHHVYAVRGTQR